VTYPLEAVGVARGTCTDSQAWPVILPDPNISDDDGLGRCPKRRLRNEPFQESWGSGAANIMEGLHGISTQAAFQLKHA